MKCKIVIEQVEPEADYKVKELYVRVKDLEEVDVQRIIKSVDNIEEKKS